MNHAGGPAKWNLSSIGFGGKYIRDLAADDQTIYCLAPTENEEVRLYFSKDSGANWFSTKFNDLKYIWKIQLFHNGTPLLFVSTRGEGGNQCLVHEATGDKWYYRGGGLPVASFMITDALIDHMDRLFIKISVEGQRGQSLLKTGNYGTTFKSVAQGLTDIFVTASVPSLAMENRGEHQLIYSSNHLPGSDPRKGHVHIIDLKKSVQRAVRIPFEEMSGNQSGSVMVDRDREGTLYATGLEGGIIYKSKDFAETWSRMPKLPIAKNAKRVVLWGYPGTDPSLPLLSVEESGSIRLYLWNIKEGEFLPACNLPEGCDILKIKSLSGGRIILATNRGLMLGNPAA